MAVIVGNEILESTRDSYQIEGVRVRLNQSEWIPPCAVAYVKALLRGTPVDDLVQSLLEDEGTNLESWHKKIGYWAGCIDDRFSETEWIDEFDSQRDGRLLEEEFTQGSKDYDDVA